MRCGGQPAQGKVKERAMERRPIKTIRNQVYQILKDDICEGRFAPGQWLQENELAERLCVSRSPIREALRQLASDGLVVEIPNKGVFVKEFTARDIEEIFDLRVLLEDYAISKLQHHLTTADMQQLIDCLNEMERLHAQKNLRAYTDMDSKLHGLLIELCGNSLLESMYARIHSLNQQFRIYSLTSTQRFNESMEEHRDIVHCLLTNNADEARAINKRHLQLAKDKIIQHFSEQEALKQAADAQPKTTAEHTDDQKQPAAGLDTVEAIGQRQQKRDQQQCHAAAGQQGCQALEGRYLIHSVPEQQGRQHIVQRHDQHRIHCAQRQPAQPKQVFAAHKLRGCYGQRADVDVPMGVLVKRNRGGDQNGKYNEQSIGHPGLPGQNADAAVEEREKK